MIWIYVWRRRGAQSGDVNPWVGWADLEKALSAKVWRLEGVLRGDSRGGAEGWWGGGDEWRGQTNREGWGDGGLLKTRRRFLKMLRGLMGSQWRDWRTAVMRSQDRVFEVHEGNRRRWVWERSDHSQAGLTWGRGWLVQQLATRGGANFSNATEVEVWGFNYRFNMGLKWGCRVEKSAVSEIWVRGWGWTDLVPIHIRSRLSCRRKTNSITPTTGNQRILGGERGRRTRYGCTVQQPIIRSHWRHPAVRRSTLLWLHMHIRTRVLLLCHFVCRSVLPIFHPCLSLFLLFVLSLINVLLQFSPLQSNSRYDHVFICDV